MLSNQKRLSFYGFLLVVLLLWVLWQIALPFTTEKILPLVIVGYAVLRITFELTLNRANIPTMATSKRGRKIMAAILHKEAQESSSKPYTIVDLGSGRGELSRKIALTIPNAQVIGIEISSWPTAQATFIQRCFGPSNISYQCLDFWTFDCSKINAVVFYLSARIAQKVGEKLSQELKPGSTVISHTFPLGPEWSSPEIIHFHAPFKETIYVYKKT